MDSLIVVVIVAMAVTFTTELLEWALAWIPFVGKYIGAVLTLPSSVLYHYSLGTEYPLLIVGSAASSFLALTLGIIVAKFSTTYTEVRRGRRG